MTWFDALNFVVLAGLGALLFRYTRAAKQRWQPDLSDGFRMTPPTGWELITATVVRDLNVPDSVTFTLAQKSPRQMRPS